MLVEIFKALLFGGAWLAVIIAGLAGQVSMVHPSGHRLIDKFEIVTGLCAVSIMSAAAEEHVGLDEYLRYYGAGISGFVRRGNETVGIISD